MNGEDAGSGGVVGGLIGVVVMFAFLGIMIASMWKVFVKAGQPGWASIVPIYNLVTMLKIAGKPTWWLVLFCIPLANFYAMYMVGTGIAKSFGKSSGFGLGLVFLGFIFFPMLAFSDARYVGPVDDEHRVLMAA
jgi:Family of unknown function (DUF5684)